jgi:hypothetical protein
MLTADGRRPATFNVDAFNAVLDSPCMLHEGATHNAHECT